MSKYNNVNPGQYKVSGRERPDTAARERLKGARREPVRLSKQERRAHKPPKQR